MEKRNRIEELVRILNEASDAYYNDRDEVMSNYEWDALFDELSRLEDETGYVMDDSPTGKTGAEETIADGRKEEHEYPALSLAKSKDVSVLQKWAGEREIWLSWKLDGITLVATYDHGSLTKLMTRGNGSVGTNITYLAAYVANIPMEIAYQGHLVVRGEAVISYSDFAMLNEMIGDTEEQYANPRNLVAGTLALDKVRAEEVRQRRVSFHAFTLVHLDEEMVSWGDRMEFLKKLGFVVVDHEKTGASQLPGVIEAWTRTVRSGSFDYPVDGLVITYDDTVYAAGGSVTGHHATNAGMAFKWQDSKAETILDHIEWSCAANMITPVAVFDMVQLEGTEVRRASLCNISEMKRLGIGADRQTTLHVIKSNMIIPKCIQADAHGTAFSIPSECPVCYAPTRISISEKTDTETLHCTNPDCMAKHIQKYSRFVSKDGMDIDGLSTKTLMRFINSGFIADFADIYRISRFREAIVSMDGFGTRAYEKMTASIEKSRKCHPVHVIYALCIPMIGLDAAKRMIAAAGSEGFFDRLSRGIGFDDIEGIGPEKSGSLMNWYGEEKNRILLDKLLDEIDMEQVAPASEKSGRCKDMIFVVTGELSRFENRDEFKAYVEAQGGKVTGSVSNKTHYLVNNDTESASSKNRKAKQLGIPVISEDQFIELFGLAVQD